MPLYECVFIARQDVPSAQVEALTQAFSTVITENGGSIAKTEHWGLKSLTYKIKKNRKGHYVLFNIDAPPAAVAEMERQMKINEDILRYLTLRVEEHEEGPSVMMQNKTARDAGRRGERGFGDRDRGFGDRDRGFGDRERGDRGDRPDRDRGERTFAPRETETPGAPS